MFTTLSTKDSHSMLSMHTHTLHNEHIIHAHIHTYIYIIYTHIFIYTIYIHTYVYHAIDKRFAQHVEHVELREGCVVVVKWRQK